MKVFFANHAQFEGENTNLGDWAIFEQMYSLLKEVKINNEPIEMLVPTSNPQFTSSKYHVICIKRGGITGIISTMKAILKSDIIVVGGGELIQDKSSLVYIPYQMIRPLLGKIFGKKLFAWAIGVGIESEISSFGRIIAKFVMSKFDVITVRDKKSKKILEEYIGIKNIPINVTADPVLNLDCAKPRNMPIPPPYIVFSIRSVYHRQHNILPFSVRKKLKLVGKEYFAAIDEFMNSMANLIDYCLDNYTYPILMLNTYCGKQMSALDDQFTKDTIKKCKNHDRITILSEGRTPSEIKYILSQARLILTVPLHPLILGASEGVPVMSFAYASKNISFMESINLKYIYRVEDINNKMDNEMIKNDIDDILRNYIQIKDKLIESVEIEKEREKLTFKLFQELCGRKYLE